MEFTQKILEIMQEKGISAYEICKNLNISNTTFSSWKKGSKPSVDKAIEIIRYLELSADELFELTPQTETLTQEEKNILKAYRQAEPGMQAAVRKLLDAPEPKSKLSISTNGKEII